MKQQTLSFFILTINIPILYVSVWSFHILLSLHVSQTYHLCQIGSFATCSPPRDAPLSSVYTNRWQTSAGEFPKVLHEVHLHVGLCV